MSDCQLMGRWRFEPVTATGVHMIDRAAASAKALSHDIMLPDDGPHSCRRARMRCACGGSCLWSPRAACTASSWLWGPSSDILWWRYAPMLGFT